MKKIITLLTLILLITACGVEDTGDLPPPPPAPGNSGSQLYLPIGMVIADLPSWAAAPVSGFNLDPQSFPEGPKDVKVSITGEDFIYHKFYTLETNQWTEHYFDQEPAGDSPWIKGSASNIVSSQAPAGWVAGNHPVIAYSCSKVNTVWNCHGNKWMMNTILVESVPNLVYEGMEVSLQPDGAEAPVPTPMYRLWSAEANNHFYTSSAEERDIAVNTQGYTYETVEGYIYSTQVVGTVPFYRLYSPGASEHFYTLSDTEVTFAQEHGYTFEFVQGYVYPTKQAGTTELHRWGHPVTSDHFYTTATTSDAQIKEAGYTYEGVAAYVLTSDAPPTSDGKIHARDQTMVKIKFSNSGAAATGPFNLKAEIAAPDGTLHAFTQTYEGLGPGITEAYTAQFIPPVMGEYSANIFLDNELQVTESNEGDNLGVYTFSVLAENLPELPGAIGDTTPASETEVYVNSLYNVMLERAPDCGGFNHWVGQLDTGARTRQGMFDVFETTPEHTAKNMSSSNYVINLYEVMLRRTPSAGEVSAWSPSIDSGANSKWVTYEAFRTTPEYGNLDQTLTKSNMCA